MKPSAETAAVATDDPDENLDDVVDDNPDDTETEAGAAAETEADANPETDAADDAVDTEAGESADAAEDDAPDKPAPRRGRSVLRWVAAAVLVAVLAWAGYEGWVLYQHHQEEVAADQALEAAKSFTLALTTVDPNAIDQNFTDVLDGATGEFKDMYTQASEQLRQALIENKAAAHGTVIDAAVKSATKNKVEVVLFVDQSVSNAAVEGPQLDRSRIVITMEKVDGRWLASKLEMP